MFAYDVRQHGAVGDGTTLDTQAIQQAIDACHAAGGGKVVLAQGRYCTGTLYLKSHVTLEIQAGAVLAGSTRIADYGTDTHKQMYRGEPHMDRCLIFARDACGIGIVGHGTIDGQGQVDNFPNADDPDQNRPMMIRFVNCSNIRMLDVTLIRPASWTSAWLYCREIAVQNIRIHSRVNGNGDGLDFDGCEDVRVTNCSFDTSDDSICLQTSRVDRPCRDVTISNCTFTSRWAGIRIGLLSRGNIERITLANCVFRDISDSGLKIQMGEGAEMKDLAFSNLVMVNVPRPVFATLCAQRACDDAPPGIPEPGRMRRLMFSNMLIDATACGKDAALIFTGMPGWPIEDITLNNISMRTAGGGTSEDAAAELNELELDVLAGHWPEYSVLGATVPACGLYARHIRGLGMNHLDFQTVSPDAREDIVLVDVT